MSTREVRTRPPSGDRLADRNGHEGILTTRVGLRFPQLVTFEQWAAAGPKLTNLADALAWCLGDWIAYGQDRYRSRYAKAVERVGLDYQTLRNYAWVARRFDLPRRRSSLSFQHHAEVASLPPAEQDTWLDRAESLGWSRNELRQQTRRARFQRQPARRTDLTMPSLRIDRTQLDLWSLAAERMDASLAAWVVTTLDQAAAMVLDVDVPTFGPDGESTGGDGPARGQLGDGRPT